MSDDGAGQGQGNQGAMKTILTTAPALAPELQNFSFSLDALTVDGSIDRLEGVVTINAKVAGKAVGHPVENSLEEGLKCDVDTEAYHGTIHVYMKGTNELWATILTITVDAGLTQQDIKVMTI